MGEPVRCFVIGELRSEWSYGGENANAAGNVAAK